jgi:glucokinase
MKQYAFGIDIGGTTVKCGFFKNDGTFVEKWEIPTRKDNGGDLILPDIADAIRERLEKHGVSMDDVEGIGVGVPGPVLDDGVVNGCVNLGWGVFNVAEKLSALLGGIRVVAGNDANVAALGEQWRGGGKGFKNVVMVTLGTGVGGGIIIGGRILPGGHGAAGEIGHMQMRKNETAVCGCGKKGCLEQYASATGIVRLAKLALADTTKPSSLRSLAEVTSKDIFDAAKTGDAMALKLVDTLGEMLGSALAHITAVVDPDVIVIGGGVSKAGQILLDAIVKHYRPAAFHACRDTEFKLAVLGNDAGMYGAVRMVLNG